MGENSIGKITFGISIVSLIISIIAFGLSVYKFIH